MKYLSLFSGIEAASIAFKSLGWKAAAFAEIDPFACAVLKHHYPDVSNLGDVEKADVDAIGPVDLIVFGSPCQSFSVAGRRLGMDDPRGNLALVGCQIVYRKRPRWFIFENVPGLFSSDSGWDFGTLLAAFAGYPPGSVFKPPENGWSNSGIVEPAAPDAYGLAWRVLDAQHVRVDGLERAVPQRRRRVFIVGCLGDWRGAAAVFFERESLCWDHPPRRSTGKRIAGTIKACADGSGTPNGAEEVDRLIAEDRIAPTLDSRKDGGGAGWGTDFLADGGMAISKSISGRPHMAHREDADTLIPDVAWALQERDHKGVDSDTKEGHLIVTGPVRDASHVDGNHNEADHLVVTPSFALDEYNQSAEAEVCYPLRTATGDGTPKINVVADPITSNEGRTYTHEGKNNFRMHNVVAFDTTQITSKDNRCKPEEGDPCHPLAGNQHPPAVAFQPRIGRNGRGQPEEIAPALNGTDAGETSDMRPCVAVFKPSHYTRDKDGAPSEIVPPLGKEPDKGDQEAVLMTGSAVRRLTPVECERLQGIPDNYTLVPYRGKPAADGNRYKALGNSFAVNCVRWIGQRIQMVEDLKC